MRLFRGVSVILNSSTTNAINFRKSPQTTYLTNGSSLQPSTTTKRLRQSNPHIQYIVPMYAQAPFHHYLLISEIKLIELLALCFRNL